MKNLFLLIGICFFALTKVHSQPNYKEISLNGIPMDSALNMIQNYQNNISHFKAPVAQSIWFDGNDFHNMIALLDKENAESSNKASIDGIRIYFASDPKSTDPKNLLVVLVSTQQGQRNANAPSHFYHTEYYKHNFDDPLFKNISSIRGKIRNRAYNIKDELLYDSCKNCNLPGCKNPGDHYLDRDKSEKMVSLFGKRPMVTYSEWFDLCFLKALDAEPNHKGFRLYFSKHEVNEPDIKGQEVKDKDAFIWVPTKKRFIGHNVDDFNCLDTSSCTAWLNGGGPGGQDNGELCPANCKL